MDMIWECGAAPEPIFDVEQNIKPAHALRMWLTVMGVITLGYQTLKLFPRENPAVREAVLLCCVYTLIHSFVLLSLGAFCVSHCNPRDVVLCEFWGRQAPRQLAQE